MDNIKDIPFAIFETWNGELVGKFHIENRSKALKVKTYLEQQVKILNRPTSKCHRLRTILEIKGIHHGRRENKI